MATSSLDVVACAHAAEEYKNSTWRNEPLSFARSQHYCVRVIQRQCDQFQEETMRALKNVLAFLSSWIQEKLGSRFC